MPSDITQDCGLGVVFPQPARRRDKWHKNPKRSTGLNNWCHSVSFATNRHITRKKLKKLAFTWSKPAQLTERLRMFCGRRRSSETATMNPQPLTDSERAYIESLISAVGGRRSIRAQACWRNAQWLLVADKEKRLRYCECGFPIPHAWVTINNKVVDVTADAARRKLKRMGFKETVGDNEHSNHEYRGSVVDRRTVLRHFFRANIWGPVRELRHPKLSAEQKAHPLYKRWKEQLRAKATRAS